ncbi:MAG: translation initiation factor IF-2, partial [Cytophagales bacterium]|nr:translation initiation factor IF-2 [Armatimonadota bacterium]
MPLKVYDLAKEYKKTNTEMLDVLKGMGLTKLSPSSDLEDDAVQRIRTTMDSAEGVGSNGTAAPLAAPTAAPVASAAGDPVEVPINVSVKELAEKLNVSGAEVQKVLMGLGVLAALNQRLAPDAVKRIAQKLGRTVVTPSAPASAITTSASTAPPVAPGSNENGSGGNGNGAGTVTRPKTGVSVRQATSVASKGKPAASDGLQTRPPVVTIMGHVDHGKTTLLDTIRKTTVASGEAGGITQHIGAYQVENNGRRITFLDTPGHAAFSAMRARGAQVTDIIVVVVAADDSIMPQTEEAITLAKEAGVPMIVAINKIDVPGADPDRVMTDLTRYEIVPEAYGGDVQTVNISAKKGEGIQDLLDAILLVSEIVVDPKADPHGAAQGTVVEAKVDKGRGVVATILVQSGTLRAGDVIVAGTSSGKIRSMTDEKGTKLIKAAPSTPVEVVGLNFVPEAGDPFQAVKDEKAARVLAQDRDIELRGERLGGPGSRVSLEALYKTLRVGETKELNVVIKGDVQGSVQAVRDSLLTLGNDEVRVRVLTTGVGPISDNDVLLASSDKDQEIKNSLVVGFNVGTTGGADKKAEQEHVQIKTFSIIYELIDAVKLAMLALLPPIYEEANIGKAEVRALFRLPGGRSIAGCYVTDGMVRRNAKARLFRGKDLLFTGDIDTLKRFKDDAREVQNGYECGLTLRDFNDLVEGDTLEVFEMR